VNPNPKIISIGFAVPERSYTQDEVFAALRYPGHFKSIFTGAAIEKRHFWVPLGGEHSWQECCEEYERGAKFLTEEVVTASLDGREAKDIGGVAFASCTGYQCPGIMHRLTRKLGLSPYVAYTNILGHGCEGGFPALMRAYDRSCVTGEPSLAISCEICSTCYFPEDGANPDPTRDYELLRANAIFGDGASAALVGFDDDPRHPYIIDFENYFDPANMEHLGFLWQDGRLRCLLTRQVPKIVPGLVRVVLERILQRNNLGVEDISWWVIHPGGKAVLDNVRDDLGLPEEKLTLSREALRLYGNCSSASIGIVGKLLMYQTVRSGEWGLVISLGAGLAVGATLLKWGAFPSKPKTPLF